MTVNRYLKSVVFFVCFFFFAKYNVLLQAFHIILSLAISTFVFFLASHSDCFYGQLITKPTNNEDPDHTRNYLGLR